MAPMNHVSCAAALLLCPALIWAASTVAAQTPAVGWWPDPYFVQVPGDTTPGWQRRELYPRGESAAQWSERVVIDSLAIGADETPQSVLDRLGAAQRADCPGFEAQRVPVPDHHMVQWSCPQNARGRGEAGFHKVLLAEGIAYVMTTQANYAAFQAGKWPVPKEQLDRWLKVQASFAPCSDWTLPGCAPHPDSFMSQDPLPLSGPAEAQAVADAEARGMELFRHDQLAWHATDFAVAKRLFKPKGQGAFLAVPGPERSGRVYFVQGKRARPNAVYTVELDEAGNASALPRARSLPQEVQPRYAALLTARDSEQFAVCSDRVNWVVMPAEHDDGWWVYALSATTQPGFMWLGGHMRFRIDAAGKRVLSAERSARTCFALDLESMAAQARDAGSTDLRPMASHLVSDVPWETHVLQSLTFGITLAVITRKAVWLVGEGQIVKVAAAE